MSGIILNHPTFPIVMPHPLSLMANIHGGNLLNLIFDVLLVTQAYEVPIGAGFAGMDFTQIPLSAAPWHVKEDLHPVLELHW